MSRFSIIGGNPFRCFNGTQTFTSLRVAAVCDTEEQVKSLVEKWYQECGGLLLVIDLTTGLPAVGLPFGTDAPPVPSPTRTYYKEIVGADIFTLPEWRHAVRSGLITELDGIGRWCRDGKESEDEVFESDPLDATHVSWYNK